MRRTFAILALAGALPMASLPAHAEVAASSKGDRVTSNVTLLAENMMPQPDNGPGRGSRPLPPPPGPGHERHLGNPRIELASLLAAQEVAIGIQPSQMDAWRRYTDAALALLPEPPKDEAAHHADHSGFAALERFSDHLAAEADKATAFKQALDGLRDALSPEQRSRAEDVLTLGPPPPFAHGRPLPPPPHGRKAPPPPPGSDGGPALQEGCGD